MIGFTKDKAKEVLNKFDIDILIVSSPVNVFYSSGLPTLHVSQNPILYVLNNHFPNLCLIRKDGEESLFHWMVYQSVNKTSWITDTHGNVSAKMAMNQIKDKIIEWNYQNGKIGVESIMPKYQLEFLKNNFPNAQFVDGDKAILEMRLIKTEEEIRRIKQSTKIAEKTITKMIESSYEGIEDYELLKIARRTIIDEGAEGWDHLTMNLGGSDPEAPGFGYKVRAGEINRFDIGAVLQGYVSDISRHMCIGKLPEGAKELIDWLIQVQEFCEKNIKPNIFPKSVLEEAKKFSKTISKFGRPLITCHSIGLECEEVELFSPTGVYESEFKENMVVDIEIWSNFKNFGLVGVEDCYVIKNHGCERISSLDKNIFII